FANITDYFTELSLKRFSQTLILDFSKKAFARITHYPLSHFRRTDIGDYIYRLSYDASAIGELFENGVVPLVLNLIAAIVTGTILIFIHPVLGMLGVFMAPILVGMLMWFQRKIGKATRASEYSNSVLFTFIQEVLSQLKVVQAFTREEAEINAFQKKEAQMLNRDVRLAQMQFLLTLCVGVIIVFGYALVISYGIAEVLAGTMTAGFLVAFIFYLDNFTGPLISCVNAVANSKESMERVSRLSQLIEKKETEEDGGVAIAINGSDIVCKNVHVYGDENVHILKNISVTIPKNKVTVIVGTNGSGKTTFISLLLRFMEVGKGNLTIDGRDIRTYAHTSLRQAVAYVPQEIELFDGTVRENVAFGNLLANDEDVERACRQAIADQFIKKLPGGYDYNVGDGGSRLSGGQRQRVLLARAIVKSDAPFLVMDEPFSFLDIRTYRRVLQTFPQWTKNKTVIIVSNVLQIIEKADFVIVFNEGRIAHTGTHAELVKKSDIADFLVSIA
ncbi:MAG: ABC transporter ATP-binding protein, partial [Patescibacteria group bacterium]